MHGATLQTLRGEIEAATTLQLALNRIALTVDAEALSTWDGPRPEDVDDIVDDDGAFDREAIGELRAKAGAALSRRYKEVSTVVIGKPTLQKLLSSMLSTGTGGVIQNEHPSASEALSALARSGALNLDFAQDAVLEVKEMLEATPPKALKPRPTAPATPKAKAKAKASRKPKAAPKKKAVASKPKSKTRNGKPKTKTPASKRRATKPKSKASASRK